jgi:NADH:ubiquinone reductase (H+-translocating)
MKSKRKRVVIVGGGFGGLEAAKSLAGVNVEVVVVDRANYHLFQPLLYQVAMAGLSPADIASPIRAILSEQENVRVVLGDVKRIDLDGRLVHFDGESLSYDWLILAVGAQTSYFGHDEWEAHAPGLKTVEDALEIRRRVLFAFEQAERSVSARERRKLLTFVVIGGGPTGVELAGSVAELANRVVARDFRTIDPGDAKVVLVEAGPRILPWFSEDLSQSAVEQLGELGVDVKTRAMVVAIDEDGVELEGAGAADELPGLGSGKEHTRIASQTVLWGAGVRGNDLARSLGVDLDPQGRVVVESDCTLPGRREVFAIGDMARFEEDGKPLPGVSPVALQQARYVARIIRWEIDAGEAPARKPFRYFDKGSMATIGRSRAIASARGIKMRGFIAWLAWLFIHLVYLVGFRNRVVVLLNWTWSYLSYQRGARLITSTGWAPATAPAAEAPRERPRPPASRPERTPSLPGASRAPESAHPRLPEATPTS